MKKAGIVTITDGSNYGNNLQNYAVIQVLKKLGYDAYTIKTDYEYSFFGQLFGKIKRFINSSNSVGVSSDNAFSSPVISNDSNIVQNYSKISKIKSMLLTNYRAVRFSDFSKKYLQKSHEKCNEARPLINNEYDILVFGSDQIWNFTLNRIKNAPDYYCGNFAPQINKIAYSASVGVDYIPDEFKELFKNSVS
ncbi:MAG: polysaccharide pyruvyl transferase family protein [Eubacterium sp.]|nr:polysaccharide pyruvyl transferase family protein [Eubacterium sp.]